MVTRQQYWAALDRLQKARVVEAQKMAEGEIALAAWWQVAESVWSSLETTLAKAEAEDWCRAAVWFHLWKEARQRGAEPGTLNLRETVPLTAPQEKALRSRTTAPTYRRIETAGSV